MGAPRLSALDTSFLGVETPTAHMHIGWAAVFDPPEDGPRPGFDELCAHVEARLFRARRCRQKLRRVPFELNAPVWVDDPDFDLSNHVIRAESRSLSRVVDTCMSQPLPRDRPLWQMWIAPRTDDGRMALVGKAHHCMVDGIAAVELGSLMLDPVPHPPAVEADAWQPAAAPGQVELLVRGVVDLVRDELRLASLPARIMSSPDRAREAVGRGARALGALADSLRPARPVNPLNREISPRRHLAYLTRPITELLEIKRAQNVKLNDVVLSVATSGVRRFLAERGERPPCVKAMVPVSVRGEEEGDALGNRISFMFIDLPCDEPDPVRRLHEIHGDTDEHKRRGRAEGGDDMLGLLGLAPPPIQRLFSRIAASPRTFNLVVSNIPGPRGEAYMCGCRLWQAYPVVPLADRHTLSIGFTSVADNGCFGLYADRDALPDVDDLASCIDAAIDELLELAGRAEPRAPAFA